MSLPSSAGRERKEATGRWWAASLLLVVAGAAVSAHLLARSFALLTSRNPSMLDLCAALLSSSCDAALTDASSWFLGVPIAGWGLVFFTTLGALLLLARFLRETFAAEALLAGCVVTLAGVVAALVLASAPLWGRHPFCPLCALVHGIVLSLLFTVHGASATPVAEQARRVGAAARWVLRSGADTALERWKILGLGSVALTAALVYQWVYVESALRRPRRAPEPSPAQVLSAYDATPSVDLPVSSEDPHLGPLDAPVRLVLFASFPCGACRSFAPNLARLHQQFGDRLLVVFKHYPLSSRCNARLTADQQPAACALAWAAEAAHRQGQFWPFCDAIFAAETRADESVIAQTVHELALDPDRFEADRRSDDTLDRVAADIELGTRLKIAGTPALFLDGRPLRSAGASTLAMLIRHEIENAGDPTHLTKTVALDSRGTP